jgi:hypothetical protein
MAKRLSTGDILETIVSDGLYYLQYLGRHVSYGDCVAVCPKKFRSRPALTPELLLASYATFYPASAAVREGLVSLIGNLPSTGIPKRFRRPGASAGKVIKTWVLEEGSSEELRQTLSDEERRLPIAAIWNHECLLHYLSTGWRPEHE